MSTKVDTTLVDFTFPRDHVKVDYVPKIARPPLAAFFIRAHFDNSATKLETRMGA